MKGKDDMQLVFVSNMLNHHQIALCDELSKKFEQFKFVSTEDTKQIGYQKSCEKDYILHYCDEKECLKAEKTICNADVVIFGGCPNELIEMRMKENRLSFIYSERFFKKGVWRRFIPQTRKKVIDRVIQYKDKNMYVLCASAYLSHELSLLGYPADKCFKWGYFPEVKHYELQKLFDKKRANSKVSILWAGRFLEWKHPESAILIADKLKSNGHDFELNIIGDGALKHHMSQMIIGKKLNDCVHLLDPMAPEEVRRHMEIADIYLATSDFYEGWGAVVNEGMNSGCSVVASHAMGASPFLIKDGENGMLYRSGNLDELYQKVVQLIENERLREDYGTNAYLSMQSLWNAKVAAERLWNISRMLMQKENVSEIYSAGPCSLAEKIKNNWYYQS